MYMCVLTMLEEMSSEEEKARVLRERSPETRGARARRACDAVSWDSTPLASTTSAHLRFAMVARDGGQGRASFATLVAQKLTNNLQIQRSRDSWPKFVGKQNFRKKNTGGSRTHLKSPYQNGKGDGMGGRAR